MTNAKKDSMSSLHPPYLQMISEAITAMKDRNGSSQPAIAKFIHENYSEQLPPNFKKTLSVQLKRFVKSEKIFKVKNSYKISSADKEKKSSDPPQKKQTTKIAYTETEKSKKTKRLSLIKTPEALKKTKTVPKIASKAPRKPGSKLPAKKAKKLIEI